MQKKIIALAIAAVFAAPVAMAETANVNVYGAIDGGLRSVTSNGTTMNTFGSGTYNSNRWGFKGSEDLGDGMKAIFGLEGGFNTGTGATAGGLFDRNATVGLEGGFGKVELGRQLTVVYKTIGTYDPLGYKFINIAGAKTAAHGERYNNDISYTGKFDAVTVMAEYAMGDQTAGDGRASTNAVGAGFASGDINVGGAYSKTKPASPATLSEETHFTVGAGFKFGDAKVSAGYAKNTVTPAGTTGSDTVNTYTFLGGNFKASSAVNVLAAYYRQVANAGGADTTTSTIVAAATYSLSKRTNMYVELDKKSVDNSVTTTDSSGYSLGLATTF